MVTKIQSYVDQLDENQDRIGSWAVHVADSKAKCRVCEGVPFDFKKGKEAFLQHCRTKKHKENMSKCNSKKKQIDLKMMSC